MTAGQPRFPRLGALARATRTLALYLVLGLITSVLIAWALAAWVPYRSLQSTTAMLPVLPKWQRPPSLKGFAITKSLLADEWRTFRALGGSRRFQQFPGDDFLARRRNPLPEGLEDLDPAVEHGIAITTHGSLMWGSAPYWDWDRSPLTLCEDARGFPFICLWQSIRSAEECTRDGVSTDRRIIGGIPLGHFGDSMNQITARGLPLRPIWPGLLANSAFYAACLFTIARTTRTARRLRRMSRGHCPRCAYDRESLYSTPCPECGWLPKRRSLAEVSTSATSA